MPHDARLGRRARAAAIASATPAAIEPFMRVPRDQIEAHARLIGRGGCIDVLLAVGGSFREVLPDPQGLDAALAGVPLRVHFDLTFSPQMLDEPADTLVVLRATTRYEIPGGVTETSTERRVSFSPQIPGPRIAEARPEANVLLDASSRTPNAHTPAYKHTRVHVRRAEQSEPEPSPGAPRP